MEGPLYHDLFNMDRLILNLVAINVRLTRARSEFCLMTNVASPDYKVEIEDIVLKACKVQINPAVIYGHAEILKTVNAKYPFTKTEVKQIAIAKGTVNFDQDQLFQNIRPNRVVVGFVNTLGAAGDYTKNPFNFQHFNLNQIGIFVDNVPVTGNVMRLNFNAASGRTIKTLEINWIVMILAVAMDFSVLKSNITSETMEHICIYYNKETFACRFSSVLPWNMPSVVSFMPTIMDISK